jgi:hypothetical protein
MTPGSGHDYCQTPPLAGGRRMSDSLAVPPHAL